MDKATDLIAERLGPLRPELLAFLRRRARTEADAEDLLQQALERATRKAHTLRDPERIVPWFFRIVRRLVAEHHAALAVDARRRARLLAEIRESEPEEMAACGCALGLFESLKPQYAQMLRRVDLDDEPLPEVAGSLGLSVNNAAVRLHRARRALRAKVEAMCGPGLRAARRACANCACDAPA
jgi:RNA polymerase sigma-70 factor (ECF subfamily)